MFPVSDNVGKFSIRDAPDWTLLLSYEGFKVSVRYQFSCGLLGSILATFNCIRIVAILISGIRSRDMTLALAFLKSLTLKMGV